jgi:transcriptional regulator with XRE-family HTH domain
MRDKVGIPLSTLAKVEQDKLSLTYDKLQRFTSRLGLTMTEFLAQNIQLGVIQPEQVHSVVARQLGARIGYRDDCAADHLGGR